MTNQSHTELAAQALRLAKSRLEDERGTYEWSIDAEITLRQCAAALESPERGQGDNYVAWLRYDDHGGNRPTTIHLCDSDAPGAFKVWRHPDSEVQRLQQKIDAMAREAYGIVSKDQPWTPEHSKNYPKQASEIINAALTIFSATPSPQAEKQPLSDELCQTLLEAQQPFPRTISRDEFLIRNTWRACCEVHGIVTKEST